MAIEILRSAILDHPSSIYFPTPPTVKDKTVSFSCLLMPMSTRLAIFAVGEHGAAADQVHAFLPASGWQFLFVKLDELGALHVAMKARLARAKTKDRDFHRLLRALLHGARHGKDYAGDGFIAGAGAGACQHEQQRHNEVKNQQRTEFNAQRMGSPEEPSVLAAYESASGGTGRPRKNQLNQQSDADKFRQRRRNMDQGAAKHAAEGRADEAKGVIDAARRAASGGGHLLGQKRRQHRLVDAVAEGKMPRR